MIHSVSDDTSAYIEEIRTNFRSLTDLDFIFARGQLAYFMNGSRPILIYRRPYPHPLRKTPSSEPAKSSSYYSDARGRFFSSNYHGPNTGGKTVSLKTVGLLTLMGQAGLIFLLQTVQKSQYFDRFIR